MSTWGEQRNGNYVFKKGRFSKEEADTLKRAIEDYVLSSGEFNSVEELVCSTGKRGHWIQIGQCLPNRSLSSIYTFARRTFSQSTLTTGRWQPDEVESLRQLVAEHGPQWVKIGRLLNRSDVICRDKWVQIEAADERKHGRWTEDEDRKLIQLVKEFTADLVGCSLCSFSLCSMCAIHGVFLAQALPASARMAPIFARPRRACFAVF